MTRIICGGLVALDLVMDMAAHPVAGQKHRAIDSRLVPGGGGMNAAIAVRRLGGEALLAGMIGDDVFGDNLRDRIRALGIDDTLLQTVPGARTAHSAITITPDGERTIVNFREEAPAPPTSPLSGGLRFDAALCDTRMPALASALMAAAREAGVPGVIDAEAPVDPASEALRTASHVAFSAQGLQDFAGGIDAAALRRAADRLGTWTCVTRGPEPVLCHDGASVCDIPVPEVTAIDTLGAGDTWHAAFALALGDGKAALDAVRHANEIAARKVARLPPFGI